MEVFPIEVSVDGRGVVAEAYPPVISPRREILVLVEVSRFEKDVEAVSKLVRSNRCGFAACLTAAY